MRPLVLLIALAALLGSGCGSEETPSQPAASPPPAAEPKPPDCRRFGDYRTCGSGPSRIERRTADGSWTLVTGSLARKVYGEWIGHWRQVYLSPDGKTLVATWSAECEVPIALFIPAQGGKPRAASGHRDWTQAPTSVALGWEGGRAKVEFLEAACGSGIHRPGVYLVDPRDVREDLRQRAAEALDGQQNLNQRLVGTCAPQWDRELLSGPRGEGDPPLSG